VAHESHGCSPSLYPGISTPGGYRRLLESFDVFWLHIGKQEAQVLRHRLSTALVHRFARATLNEKSDYRCDVGCSTVDDAGACAHNNVIAKSNSANPGVLSLSNMNCVMSCLSSSVGRTSRIGVWKVWIDHIVHAGSTFCQHPCRPAYHPAQWAHPAPPCLPQPP